MAAAAPPILTVEHVAVRFGGIQALTDVNFEIAPGKIFGLIGPNGAGKTTLFNCVSGVYTPTEGIIRYQGRVLNPIPIHRRSLMGIARTFQNIALFGTLTVRENLMLPVDVREKRGFVSDAFRGPRASFGDGKAIERARGILHFLGLLEHENTLAGDLPVGLQRRVEIGRALCQRPDLLLLDEPASGLDARETADLGRVLPLIRDRLGITILLVDHDMALVMKVCEEICALDFGRIIAQGTPAEIRANPQVISAYLGEAAKKQEDAFTSEALKVTADVETEVTV